MICNVPFESWHADQIHDKLQPAQLGEADLYTRGSFEQFEQHPSCTAMRDGIVLSCGGAVPLWPGRAFAWAWMSNRVEPRDMIGIHRVALNLIVDLQKDPRYNRIETTVLYDFEAGHDWARMLGFSPEGDLKAYDLQGRDHTLYARIANHGERSTGSSNYRRRRVGRKRRPGFPASQVSTEGSEAERGSSPPDSGSE